MTAPAPAQLAAFVQQVYPQLDRLSYYQILRVPAAATAAVIRASYYQIAAQLHPDRYHSLPDPVLRDQLESIFARVTEGYRVLVDSQKRAAYDRQLAAGRMRYQAERATGPKNPEDTIRDPQAKKFFRMGMMCLARKDWRGASMNFNFARSTEPGTAIITDKLAEAQAGLKAASPTSK